MASAPWNDTSVYKVSRLEKRLHRLEVENARKSSDLEIHLQEKLQVQGAKDELRKQLSELETHSYLENTALKTELKSLRVERDFLMTRLMRTDAENLRVERDYYVSQLVRSSQNEAFLQNECDTLKRRAEGLKQQILDLDKDRRETAMELRHATQFKRDVEQSTICPVCKSGIHAPAALKCGHELCASCLLDWVPTNPPFSHVCPVCRDIITSAPSFPCGFSDAARAIWGIPGGVDVAAVQTALRVYTW